MSCQKSFKLLKKRFTITPILAYFDFEKKYIIKTDALNNVLAGVLF